MNGNIPCKVHTRTDGLYALNSKKKTIKHNMLELCFTKPYSVNKRVCADIKANLMAGQEGMDG